MSWVTICWIVYVVSLINAIRWGVAKKLFAFFLAAGVVLAVCGCFVTFFVREEPIKNNDYWWWKVAQNGDNYYYLYKELNKEPVLYGGKDPNAGPHRIIVRRNYYGFKERAIDFGNVSVVK